MPNDIEQLRALRNSVAAAVGPNRELDFAAAMAFGWTRYRYPQMSGPHRWRDDNGKQCGQWDVPHFTASIDAVEALRQRLLPDHHFGAELSNEPYKGNFLAWTAYDGKTWHCHAPTEPLARLLALLDALIGHDDVELSQ